MALNLTLSTLTMPDGTEFPGTPQLLNELLVQYTEITGQDSFNGINYGSTTPDADNRDKPWYRLDNSDNEMGWYAWDGADWVLLPCRVQTGTQIQRDALASPFDGQLYFVTGSAALSIYQGGEWKPVIPTQERFHYDSSYIYPQHQLLASVSGGVANWTAIDLTPYISALGLDAVNSEDEDKYEIKAALIRLEVKMGPSGFLTHTWYCNLRASSNDSYSTTATDVLQASIRMTADDSQASGSDSITGPVPLKPNTNNIYYDLTGDIAPGLEGNVWLMGFIYKTTDAYFS